MGCCIERLSRHPQSLMLLLLCCLAKHTDRMCITPKYQNSMKAESQERSQNVWQVELGSSISSYAPDMTQLCMAIHMRYVLTLRNMPSPCCKTQEDTYTETHTVSIDFALLGN